MYIDTAVHGPHSGYTWFNKTSGAQYSELLQHGTCTKMVELMAILVVAESCHRDMNLKKNSNLCRFEAGNTRA